LHNPSDLELLVEVFRQGISTHGADRGCGLKGCAAKAIKSMPSWTCACPTSACFSNPHAAHTSPTAYCYEGPPLQWGTHIGFAFGLAA
jgi:hypothetical protein